MAKRLASLNEPTRVLELGVGIGMGMLVTLDEAIQHNATLEYVGLPRTWVTTEVLTQLDPWSRVTR